ncbi:MAG: cell division FtsA domain-containing protein [Patescibacteria group bacterium]
MFRKFFSRFRPRAQETDQVVLALDIGGEFVKALIYRIEENHGFVIGYSKIRQKLGDMAAGTVANIAGVSEACGQAIDQAAKQAGVQPEQAVMGIAGELVRGATTTISYSRENPQVRIEMPELRAIVQRVQSRAFDKVRRELSRDTGHREIDVKLVNAAIIDSKIDGQRSPNPIGFQGSEVSLSVFNSFAPLVHFGALQTIAAELELDLLTIAAEPFAVARALPDEDLSAIFIDVGGGTTDLALLRGGGDLTTKMFAVGGRTFTKRIGHTLNVSHDEAEQLKLDYAHNKLSERKQKIVANALAGDIDVWSAGVEVALAEMIGDAELPQKILLCGGGSKLPEIKKILTDPKFAENLPFRGKPIVKFLCPDDITNFTDQTGLIRTVQDVTPLALANLGIALAGEESLLSSILRKSVKLIQN